MGSVLFLLLLDVVRKVGESLYVINIAPRSVVDGRTNSPFRRSWTVCFIRVPIVTLYRFADAMRNLVICYVRSSDNLCGVIRPRAQ